MGVGYLVCLLSFRKCFCISFILRCPGEVCHCRRGCCDHSLWGEVFLRCGRCLTWRRGGGESCRRWIIVCRFMRPRISKHRLHSTYHCSMPNAKVCSLWHQWPLFWVPYSKSSTNISITCTIRSGESPCAAICSTVNPWLLIWYISAPFC